MSSYTQGKQIFEKGGKLENLYFDSQILNVI
jgi:hypothetical protein